MAIYPVCQVHFQGRGRGSRRRLQAGSPQEPVTREPGRVPRVARLRALALRLDERLRCGDLASYREVAELGHVTRARVSQILNLLYLSPDIQEAILFLPRTMRGRDPIVLRDLEGRVKATEAIAAKEKDNAERQRLNEEARQLAKELARHRVPPSPKFICDDETPEKLSRLLALHDGRMFLAAAEGTVLEIAKRRYSKRPNVEVFLKAHAGDTLRMGRVRHA